MQLSFLTALRNKITNGWKTYIFDEITVSHLLYYQINGKKLCLNSRHSTRVSLVILYQGFDLSLLLDIFRGSFSSSITQSKICSIQSTSQVVRWETFASSFSCIRHRPLSISPAAAAGRTPCIRQTFFPSLFPSVSSNPPSLWILSWSARWEAKWRPLLRSHYLPRSCSGSGSSVRKGNHVEDDRREMWTRPWRGRRQELGEFSVWQRRRRRRRIG